jgi:hypothetical protein
MIYFELNLDGNVKVYEMTDRLVILRAAIETEARALPVAETIDEAIEYVRACCFHFECFETLEDADLWQSLYSGFRAAEVHKEFARYTKRLIAFQTQTEAA